jgi:membrane-bound transcription factor site-1 protease
MRRSRGTARARLALALAACLACVLARGVAGEARGAENVARAPSGRCEAAAGREGPAGAWDAETSAAPESCDARARDARRAEGTGAPPSVATDEGRSDAEARDRAVGRSEDDDDDGGDKGHRAEKRRRGEDDGAVRTEFLRDRYIVRFSEYKMIGEHRAALEQALGPPSNARELDPKLYGNAFADERDEEKNRDEKDARFEWTFVERKNKAAAFPTDFAVVAFEETLSDDDANEPDVTARFARGEKKRTTTTTTRPKRGASKAFSYPSSARRAIESAAGVRDVRLEQKFTRALAWDESSSGESSSRESRSRRLRAGDPRNEQEPRDAAKKRAETETAESGLRWSAEAPESRGARRARQRAERSSVTRASHGGGGGASPGRLRTRPTIGMEPDGFEYEDASTGRRGYHTGENAFPLADAEEEDDDDDVSSSDVERRRRALLRLSRASSPGVAESMGAGFLWEKGFSGSGVKMGVFDTGVKADHPHFREVKERSNWTHEDTLADGLGHGTFVAGVVASQDSSCPGFAPDAEIHTFRVFTNDQVSYTSWFLDAFNYAIASEVNVINLSIGGPDYLDYPFTDKIDEIVANGIIMISAIGNDGPLWGTLNNPADQLDVIGVGGIDFKDQIAPFSSRGMSTHELPHGYGRVKPDIVAYGRDVMGSKIQGGCRSLSGTSVASPVVAGAVTLLASTVPQEKRWDILNPASMKQALVEGAVRLNSAGDSSMYAQGAGKLNLVNAYEILKSYTPRASLVPTSLDFEHETSCPYAWPHCAQPLYHGAMPFMFNATIVNGMGLGGWLKAPPKFEPSTEDESSDDLGAHLDFRFDFSETLWPWSGFLAMYVRVKESAKASSGVASGVITFTVESPPGRGETETRSSVVSVPVRFSVAPTPPRSKRVLWSQFHSVRYPPGYIPRDSLDVKADILDWHGDHPHTNFHAMYDALRREGYFVEILGSPLTCFDAREYGALLLVDSEEEFSVDEITKLNDDVLYKGLGVAVFAEWFNVKQMESMRFFDDNTHSHWTPVTGGGNIPALNDLLKPFGVQLGDRLLKGTAMLKSGEPIVYATGADIAQAPSGAHVHVAHLADHAANEPGAYGDDAKQKKAKPRNAEFAIAAFLDESALGGDEERTGRVSVFGDSNCLDSSHSTSECFPLLIRTLKFLAEKDDDTGLTPRDGSKRTKESYAPYGANWVPPVRRSDVDFDTFSTTKGGHPGNEGRTKCGANDPLAFQDEELQARDAYASIGWSRARAAATVAARPVNWRERLGAEAAAELAALGDVFAERRREVAGVAGERIGDTLSDSRSRLEDETERRRDDVFTEAGSNGGGSPERLDGAGFGSLVHRPGFGGGVTGTASFLNGKRFGALTADKVGMGAVATFALVAAARLRKSKRRASKKTLSSAALAKRGRRLAPP